MYITLSRTVLPHNGRFCGGVFWIRDILVRIRIRGSVPLTNRSGFRIRILLFSSQDLQAANKRLIFSHSFFCLLLLEGTYINIIFKDKKP
jgi:hypothetical protein